MRRARRWCGRAKEEDGHGEARGGQGWSTYLRCAAATPLVQVYRAGFVLGAEASKAVRANSTWIRTSTPPNWSMGKTIVRWRAWNSLEFPWFNTKLIQTLEFGARILISNSLQPNTALKWLFFTVYNYITPKDANSSHTYGLLHSWVPLLLNYLPHIPCRSLTRQIFPAQHNNTLTTTKKIKTKHLKRGNQIITNYHVSIDWIISVLFSSLCICGASLS
jgi:hypothetical protein